MNSNKHTLTTDIKRSVSPALTLFCYRALQDIERLGIEQVFFITREGIFLKAIFERVAAQVPELQKLTRHMQFKLLYTSRTASIVGRYTKNHTITNIVQPLLLTKQQFTLKNLLHAWNVSLEDFSATTQKILLQHMNQCGEYALSHLMYDSAIGKEFDSILTKNQQLFYQYLVQEGFFETDNIALIDIGWRGTIQDNIASLLTRKQHSEKIYGFYFGTQKNNAEIDRSSLNSKILPGYLLNSNTDLDMHVFMHAVPMLETMLGCESMSSVQGYEQLSSHKIVPLFEQRKAQPATSRFQHFVQSVILNGCDLYAATTKNPTFSSTTETTRCRKKFIKFFINPPRRHIKHFDHLNFDYDWGEQNASIIVYRPRLKEWLQPIKLIKKLMIATWPHASLKRFFLLCEVYNWYRKHYYKHPVLSIVVNKLKFWARFFSKMVR